MDGFTTWTDERHDGCIPWSRRICDRWRGDVTSGSLEADGPKLDDLLKPCVTFVAWVVSKNLRIELSCTPRPTTIEGSPIKKGSHKLRVLIDLLWLKIFANPPSPSAPLIHRHPTRYRSRPYLVRIVISFFFFFSFLLYGYWILDFGFWIFYYGF